MMTAVYLTAAALIVVAIYFGVRYFVRTSQRFGGERVIICPETGKQALVEVDARHAALTNLIGQPICSLSTARVGRSSKIVDRTVCCNWMSRLKSVWCAACSRSGIAQRPALSANGRLSQSR